MRFSAALAIGILALTALAPAASADLSWNSGLAVFVTIPDQEYAVGDDMIITVHVFNAGEYYTPDEVDLTVAESRDIGLTEQATGRYRGVVTIMEEDLDVDGDFYVHASARDEGLWLDDTASDSFYLNIGEGEGFDVAVDLEEPGDMFPAPGDDVGFLVELTYQGSRVDPDTDSLKVYSYDPAWTETELAVTRVGTGQFEGEFTVPSGLKESTEYTLWAEAEYTDTRTYSGTGMASVNVYFYDIWAHIIDVSPSRTQMEVFVLDGTGAPVGGADVKVDWEYLDDAFDTKEGSASGTTDADGKAPVEATYADLGKDASMVEVSGSAASGGLTQLFEGTLWVREYTGFDGGMTGSGFEVQLLTEEPFEPGSSVTMDHIAHMDGDPLKATEVYFYVVDLHNIHRFGSETTDAEGAFEFPLNVPDLPSGSTYSYIYSYYHLEGEYTWDQENEWLLVGDYSTTTLINDLLDPKATLSVQPFSVGEVVQVSLDHPDAGGGGDQAMVIWGIGTMPDWEHIDNLEWESWSSDGINFLNIAPCQWVDDHYEATFGCPGFLSETDSIYVYGLVVFEDDGEGLEGAHAAKLDAVSPVPPNPAPTAIITTPTDAQKVGGTVKFKGTAADDTSVEKVEVRIDGGAWMTASGTTSWTYEVRTKQMVEGNHTLEVRSYDGEKYSDVQEVSFEVDQSVAKKDDGKDDGPGFGVTAMLLALVAAALAGLRGRR